MSVPHLRLSLSLKTVQPLSKQRWRKRLLLHGGDLRAAANYRRSCVEKLLDHLKEPNTGTLHRRIENYKKRDEQRGAALLAVKWVGNAGSHVDDIARADIYDAFDILEAVLTEVFSCADSKVAKSVDAINKRGSRSRHTANNAT